MKKPLLYFSFFIFNFSFCISHAQIISSPVGNGIGGMTGNGGPATSAEIDFPVDVQIDDSANIYDVELFSNVIRKTSALTGYINACVGNGAAGFSGDGGPASAAEIDEPAGVAVDTARNIYVADYQNQRIRKVDARTGIITTIAGNGSLGYIGDGGPATASELRDPEDVSTDDSGNVYIADTYNYAIRKIWVKDGIITTIAGNGVQGFYGDGGLATAAEIDHTEKVKADAAGNYYISDAGNERVRYVSASSGIITTVAGNGAVGSSGDGGPATAAELDYPEGIAVDPSGNFYISGLSTQNVRMVNKLTGIITDVAGNGVGGFFGDGGLATAAELNAPDGVDFDKTGNMYISDSQDNHIRKVSGIFTSIPVITNPVDVTVYPVPSSGLVNVQLPGDGYNTVNIYDDLGRIVYIQNLDPSERDKKMEVNLGGVSNGIYYMQITTKTGNIGKRIVISK